MHIPQEAPLFVLTCSYPCRKRIVRLAVTGYTVRRGALICTASGLQLKYVSMKNCNIILLYTEDKKVDSSPERETTVAR